MNKKWPLSLISIILSLTPLAICLLLLGDIWGLEKGMHALYGRAGEDSGIHFSTHGPNFFDTVAAHYSITASLLCLNLIGVYFHRTNGSIVLRFIFLAATIMLLGKLLGFKYSIDESAALFYRNWLTASAWFDWYSIGCIVTLAVFETCINLYDRSTKSNPKLPA